MSLSNKNLKSFKITDLENIYNIPQIANEYAQQPYNIGDYVNYQGVIYRCTTQISVAESWNSSHWTSVMLADDVRDNYNDLKSAINDIQLKNGTDITIKDYIIYPSGIWHYEAAGAIGYLYPIKAGDVIYIKARSNSSAYYALLESFDSNIVNGGSVDLADGCTGSTKITANQSIEVTSVNTRYLWINSIEGKNNYMPQIITVNGLNVVLTDTLKEAILHNCEAINNTNANINSLLDKHVGDVVSPDDYTGTDAEKLQQAFDDCAANGGVIKISREYNITSNITISHIYSQNHRIEIVGDSSNSKLSMNTFKFVGTANNTGGVRFREVTFSGLGTLIDNEYLVELYFDNCQIYNFAYVVRGDNYLQGIAFERCLIRGITQRVVEIANYQVYGLQFRYCIIEACNSFVFLYYVNRAVFTGNTIEATDKTPITLYVSIKSVEISNNYFELNGTGTQIDLSNLSTASLRNIRIINNFIYEDRDCKAIKIPRSTSTNKGNIIIESNVINERANTYLVDADPSIHYKDVFCMSNLGNITDVSDGVLYVFNAQSFIDNI